MDKNTGVITYDVHELDLHKLKEKVQALGAKELVIYGIGNNGDHAYRLFNNLGIKVKYFIDIKARNSVDKFRGSLVITPDAFLERYDGEYVVISPSIHESILNWMKAKGIPEDKLIVEFYRTESVTIDYGESYYGSKPSGDIDYCSVKPTHVQATFITIAYNTPENLLRRAIESVLEQTLRDFKYLFIVNGATDDTLKIAEEYAELDKRISIVNIQQNLPWTDPELLAAIKNNIEGDYCCQLDSDDYYDKEFLEETILIGARNAADIVCVRTCLFCADGSFDPLKDGLEYDEHDKYYFNIVHPLYRIIGQHNIMRCYAKSQICSTFWGKLYSNTLMERYLDYLLSLSSEERELYYRLDIAMTYRILSMSERVFYSDKILHFSQYSGKNSTFTLAPIEWLMSLWHAYTGIKKRMGEYYCKRAAYKQAKGFLKVHLMWMVGRKGMLKNPQEWKYYDRIIEHFREMLFDPVFSKVLFDKKNHRVKECMEFYETIKNLVEQGGRS